jgi:hypothetical protein
VIPFVQTLKFEKGLIQNHHKLVLIYFFGSGVISTSFSSFKYFKFVPCILSGLFGTAFSFTLIKITNIIAKIGG